MLQSIQYHCDFCEEAITKKRPGWIEFFSFSKKGKPNGYPVREPYGFHIKHRGCSRTVGGSYAIEIPNRLNVADDDDFEHHLSLEHWLRHLHNRTWFDNDMFRRMCRYEKV